jgi:hypothetical protein
MRIVLARRYDLLSRQAAVMATMEAGRRRSMR